MGDTLHDPDCLHREQPDHFLLGLSGSRSERGGSFPPALVRRSFTQCTDVFSGRLVWIVFGFCLNVSKCPFRSMLPDAVDDFKVQNPDIHGHEALFYSFYVFFIKFASGISLGVSTLSMK